jgi:hypothetical protein
MRVAAQKSQEPLSGETIVLESGGQSAEKVIVSSQQYATQQAKNQDSTPDSIKPEKVAQLPTSD